MYGLFGLREYYDTKQSEFAARAATLHVAPVVAYAPDRTYDDAHILNRALYCDPCGIQLLSAQDVALHEKGKRHKKKLRGLASQSRASSMMGDDASSSSAKRAKIHDERDDEGDDKP
ncbi:Aste57867_6229 [Aphanomyces stellatus]|nr:hypothetical protein As57867_006215 [Aphanomyces stellatus]VFT83229.1 Aste57867_6229 [Aphanomyces stellatus]